VVGVLGLLALGGVVEVLGVPGLVGLVGLLGVALMIVQVMTVEAAFSPAIPPFHAIPTHTVRARNCAVALAVFRNRALASLGGIVDVLVLVREAN